MLSIETFRSEALDCAEVSSVDIGQPLALRGEYPFIASAHFVVQVQVPPIHEHSVFWGACLHPIVT
jgi:hypothetical protein